MPVSDRTFPWALPLARVELQREKVGGSKDCIYINAEASEVLPKTYMDKYMAEPGMRTEPVLVEDKVRDRAKFCLIFDGVPHGRHEFIPVAWDFVDWASNKVTSDVRLSTGCPEGPDHPA